MKGLGKRILMMAAVTAVCVWAAGKSGYAVKPYRLDEDSRYRRSRNRTRQSSTAGRYMTALSSAIERSMCSRSKQVM